MTRRWYRIISGLGVTASLVLTGLAMPGIAQAAPVPGIPVTPMVPLLRVTMSDGVAAPKPGDRLTYAITITDRDTVPLPMDVRLTAPGDLGDIAVGDGGSLTGRLLSWPASLTPGQAVAVHFTAKVGDATMRLATTACAYLSGSDRPTACASDLDTVVLPGDGIGWGSIGGSFALVAIAAGAVLTLRRRRAVVAPSAAAPSATAATVTAPTVTAPAAAATAPKAAARAVAEPMLDALDDDVARV